LLKKQGPCIDPDSRGRWCSSVRLFAPGCRSYPLKNTNLPTSVFRNTGHVTTKIQEISPKLKMIVIQGTGLSSRFRNVWVSGSTAGPNIEGHRKAKNRRPSQWRRMLSEYPDVFLLSCACQHDALRACNCVVHDVEHCISRSGCSGLKHNADGTTGAGSQG